MVKLDRSMLPRGVSFDRKEGLYAKLGPQDQVVHLGVYQNGQRKPGTWALDIALNGSWARVEQVHTHEWHSDPPPLQDDEHPSLIAWATPWIEKISDAMKDQPPGQLHISCSFCGKSQSEVRKIIAGPSVFICDECIGLCSDILQEEDSRAP